MLKELKAWWRQRRILKLAAAAAYYQAAAEEMQGQLSRVNLSDWNIDKVSSLRGKAAAANAKLKLLQGN